MSVRAVENDRRLLQRSPAEVFEDHLRLREAGALEEDLHRNYADDVLLLTCNSIQRGHDGIRESARRLKAQLPNVHFHFTARQVADRYALLVWGASSNNYRVGCGVDTFVICDGKIRVQTIHYDLLQT
ncbi:nuclear transport factor 2 family protein [Dongia deserti]|uniref:nuclear transport factor 2 family protein n=1 Tax=Dongia deserti TaxID=2268030 RepID=UPI0013C518AA|nr:nuclear transport factor 2 family protein [Dongia deserti]